MEMSFEKPVVKRVINPPPSIGTLVDAKDVIVRGRAIEWLELAKSVPPSKALKLTQPECESMGTTISNIRYSVMSLVRQNKLPDSMKVKINNRQKVVFIINTEKPESRQRY